MEPSSTDEAINYTAENFRRMQMLAEGKAAEHQHKINSLRHQQDNGVNILIKPVKVLAIGIHRHRLGTYTDLAAHFQQRAEDQMLR